MYDFLYNIYVSYPKFGKIGWIGRKIDGLIYRIAAFIARRVMNRNFPAKLAKERYELNKEERKEKLIFSITSFPARIDDIWISLRTLFRQTVKADKIILWLSENEFPTKELPKTLTDLCEFGLEIRWVENYRSHRKYYFALQEFPNDLIFTFDDDLFYANKTVERLMETYRVNPGAICASRANNIKFDDQGAPLPYAKWDFQYIKKSENLFFTSGAIGTLFPPNSMHKDVLDIDNAMKICKFADDIWLNIMARRINTPIIVSKYYKRMAIEIGRSQEVALCNINVLGGKNDEQLTAVCEKYNFRYIKK